MRKRRKYIKRNYTCMSPMEVYDLVRNGDLKKFPSNYLDKNTIKEIVREVLINELKLTRSDILKQVDHDFMTKHYMGGFRKFFDMKDHNVITYSFPEMSIHGWEFTKVEPHYWKDKNNQREFLLWVMEQECINSKSKEDLRKFTAETVRNYGGSRLFKVEPDFYTILKTVINDDFKEWEIMKVRVWKEEKIITAVKWLVEEKLNYTLEEACLLKVSDFKKYNLDGMLQRGCNHSILYALNLAYGNCFVRDGTRGIILRKGN